MRTDWSFTESCTIVSSGEISIFRNRLITELLFNRISALKRTEVSGSTTVAFTRPGAVCGISLLIGMIFCTGAGEYWLMMFDTFAGSMGLIVIAFFESVVVAYVYGYKKFTDDVESMVGERPGIFWQVMWRLVQLVCADLRRSTVFICHFWLNLIISF